MNVIEMNEILAEFRNPLMDKIINTLRVDPNSRGIDMGCGIGSITNLLVEKMGLKEKTIGLDFSEEAVKFANERYSQDNVQFIQGDINHLDLDDNSFDWIWSMDTVWAGPKRFGCPAEEPDGILEGYNRVLKPGGKLFLLYWTSQKLLPGYPLLEARLNATVSANAPYGDDMDPGRHVMNGLAWLKKADFSSVKASSFVGDISGPLDENSKKALMIFFDMFWGDSVNMVSKEDRIKLNDLRSPRSKDFILNRDDYYGYYVYTLFRGTKR